jgi:glycosyltransferase involved in cell wall biosynthesis
MEEDQQLTTTAEVTTPRAVVSSLPLGAEEPRGISPVLLREPCHLEIVIPALNEAERLPRTLLATTRYLEKQPYSSAVVVVDNGSSDQTADLTSRVWSQRVPVHLTGCARRGKGAAVRRGILTSRARFIGYMDADLATPIETLDAVMPILGDNQAVIASRRMRGAALAKKQPPHRVLGGMVFHAVSHRVMGDLTDTQCGFKFFDGELARSAARQMTIEGFAFDVELLQIMSWLGASITEIPVVWTDAEGSTFSALRDGGRVALDMYRLSRRRPA